MKLVLSTSVDASKRRFTGLVQVKFRAVYFFWWAQVVVQAPGLSRTTHSSHTVPLAAIAVCQGQPTSSTSHIFPLHQAGLGSMAKPCPSARPLEPLLPSTSSYHPIILFGSLLEIVDLPGVAFRLTHIFCVAARSGSLPSIVLCSTSLGLNWPAAQPSFPCLPRTCLKTDQPSLTSSQPTTSTELRTCSFPITTHLVSTPRFTRTAHRDSLNSNLLLRDIVHSMTFTIRGLVVPTRPRHRRSH